MCLGTLEGAQKIQLVGNFPHKRFWFTNAQTKFTIFPSTVFLSAPLMFKSRKHLTNKRADYNWTDIGLSYKRNTVCSHNS